MAETGSIKARIAALNIEQVHIPTPATRPSYTYDQATTAKKKPPPPPPGQRPPVPPRQQTVNNPPIQSNAPTSTRGQGNLPAAERPLTPKVSPALPPRPPPRTTPKQAPGLPPRKSSEYSVKRRDSIESIATVSSGISSLSLGSALSTGTPNGGGYNRVRAPVYDPATLPPLPAKKALEDPKQSKGTMKAMKSTSNEVPSRAMPPSLPSRPPLPTRPESKTQDDAQPERPRVLPPPNLPTRSALSFGLNKSTESPPPIPATRPVTTTPTPAPGAPPPIPLASRPNLDAIMASKPKPGAVGVCLNCRDFSGPDNLAARYPRNNLPSSDVAWLATELTSPFSSPTDKARAIFVWLHHNVDYDTHSFFGGNISHTTPERTITTGLAVCSGYAGLFSALALKAGLECVVVSGHGKGYGHTALQPGDAIPPFNCSHAWNAVRIDHGEWKLIDACWGAGSVCGQNYSRHFKPAEFTKDNIEFGYTHFPEDDRYFFRSDGRTVSWEEYIMEDVGGRVRIYGDCASDHGLGPRTFQPASACIKAHDPHDVPTIRFQFAALCPHWNSERHGKGKPYLMTLHVGGRDGRKSEHLPFNTDGKVWWLDVDRNQLGAPGQKVSVFAVTDFDGRDGRGLTITEFKRRQGRCAMKWSSVAMWELT